MSNYLFGKIKLGDIITFRYLKPGVTGFQPPRTIMVLAPNYQGHLHGIKITNLSVMEQEYLQRVLQIAYNSPNNIYAPLEADIQNRKKELDVLNQQRNQLIQNGRRVVMTPVPPNDPNFQFMDRAKKILGSVIGRVNTFGRNQTEQRPATNPQEIQQQLAKHDQMINQKKIELDQYIKTLQNQKQTLGQFPVVPTDPYRFYHTFLKPFIGNNKRMKDIYRKFNIAQVSTPRIIKSVGIIPNVQR